MKSSLGYIFKAKSVVVVGGSEKKGTIGRAIMENLLGIGTGRKFHGKIYVVNIKYDKVFGFPVYRSVKDLPEPVDLAVIAVPAKVVPSVIEDCGKRGVKGAIVISAGFSETGEEGKRLEQELVKTAQKYGIRVIGPNCLGIYSPLNNLDTIFNPSDRQDKPDAGPIAIISQSGALGAALLDYCAAEKLGVSYFVSYGNAADVDESDLIEFLGYDEHTKVIVAYLEGVKNGRKFVTICEKISKIKPIIVFKAGKTKAGSRAIVSHTGSMAGSPQIFNAVAKKCGLILVDTIEEMFATAKALSKLSLPESDDVIIVTNGGGAGVITTDAIEMLGLRMKELSEDTKRNLRKVLPPMASVENPVDILGDAPAKRYKDSLEIVAQEKPGIIIVIALVQSPALDHSEFIKVVSEFKQKSNLPVLAVIPGGRKAHEVRMLLEKHGVPTYSEPEIAVKVAKHMVEYAKWRRTHM